MGTGHGVRKPMQPRRRKVMLNVTAVKRGQPSVAGDWMELITHWWDCEDTKRWSNHKGRKAGLHTTKRGRGRVGTLIARDQKRRRR